MLPDNMYDFYHTMGLVSSIIFICLNMLFVLCFYSVVYDLIQKHYQTPILKSSIFFLFLSYGIAILSYITSQDMTTEKCLKEKEDVLSLLIKQGELKDIMNLVENRRVPVRPYHAQLALDLMWESEETESEEDMRNIYNYIRSKYSPRTTELQYSGYRVPLPPN